jgi:hypothetical protein
MSDMHINELKSASILTLKGVALIFLAGFSLMAILAVIPADHYMQAHRDKVSRLESLGSPKLVLVGGSSVAMSVDSAFLEKEVGLPVVNMGMHAGIGLRLMLDEVRSHVGEGDRIVIVGEYQHLTGILNGEIGLLRLCRTEPSIALNFTSHRQWLSLFKNFSYLWERQAQKLVDFVKTGEFPKDKGTVTMAKEGINPWGDLVTHLGKESPGIGDRRVFDGSEEIDGEAFSYLRQRVGYFKRQGVDIFWMFPPIPDRDFNTHQSLIRELEGKLKDVPDLILLSSPAQVSYPVGAFFDTEYHLSEIPRQDYSGLLAQALIQFGSNGE